MAFNAGNRPDYQQLIKGDMTVNPDGPWRGAFSMEALRCLVENEAQGAQDLATTVMTAMHIDQKKRDAQMAQDKKTGPPDVPVGETNLAHVYDLIYQRLTPDQRQAMHDELAYVSWHAAHYGTFEDTTAARSTWATFCHHVIPLLAIDQLMIFNQGLSPDELDAISRWEKYILASEQEASK